MATIKAFRGIRFNEQRVGSFDNVVTPPFDVIDSPTRDQLESLSPYNMVRLLLPKDDDGLSRYEAAARDLEAWIGDGVLEQDPEDSFYLLEQGFLGLDGKQHVRRAFFAVAQLPQPGEERTVLDHERTFATKVQDRLSLMETTQANLGAVFVLYEDPDKTLAPFLGIMDRQEPDMTAKTIDGVTQRLWRVPPDERVTAFFASKTLYIADGHHRYRTAMEYRDRMREQHPGPVLQPYDYVLLGFVEFQDPGLRVWPTHRLLDPRDGFDPAAFLRDLERSFVVESVQDGLPERVAGGNNCTLGLAVHGTGQYLLTLRDVDRATLLGEEFAPVLRDLDVAVLHGCIVEGLLGFDKDAELLYEPNGERAVSRVAAGEKRIALLLKAILPEQVRACAEAGVYMPEKATYFFPKLPSGAVFHRFV